MLEALGKKTSLNDEEQMIVSLTKELRSLVRTRVEAASLLVSEKDAAHIGYAAIINLITYFLRHISHDHYGLLDEMYENCKKVFDQNSYKVEL